jgi:hypothetical protein
LPPIRVSSYNMTDPQSWFLQRQQQLADRVGEPVLLAIHLCYDDWFEVIIRSFTDRWGMAAGREVEAAVAGALEMLLEMDRVIAEGWAAGPVETWPSVTQPGPRAGV